MSRLFKVVPLALAIIALGVIAASCGSGKAEFRVVNAIANPVEGIDIYLNGTKVFTDVSFESTNPGSGYQGISGGGVTFEVFPTGATSGQWIDSSLNMSGSNAYTVLLTGNTTQQGAQYPYAAQLFTDTNPTPTSGDVEFRILDASTTVGAVDIYIGPTEDGFAGSQKVASISYSNNNSNYQNVGLSTSQNLTIYVTVSGTTSVITSFQDQGLSAGTIHTLVLVDQSGGFYPPQLLPLATD